MRESFDMMVFVHASFAIGGGSVLLLVVASWLSMRRAEAKREASRSK